MNKETNGVKPKVLKSKSGKELITDPEERAKYVCENLEKVQSILDDVAERTGVPYLVLSDLACDVFANIGKAFLHSAESCAKVYPERFALCRDYFSTVGITDIDMAHLTIRTLPRNHKTKGGRK